MRLSFKSNISLKPGFSVADLKEAIKADPKCFTEKVAGLIDEKDDKKSKLTLAQFMSHVKDNHAALADIPVQVVAQNDEREVKFVASTAFPALTSQLAIARLNTAFTEAPSVVDALVTDMESNNKVDFVAGVLIEEKVDVKNVKEGDDFPEIGAGEEIYQINSLRNGRRISLTGEAISENKANDFVRRVTQMGRIAAMIQERQGLRRITDHDGSATSGKPPYVLNTKAGTALYSTTANTPGTRTASGTRINNNPLVDSTNLDTALARLRGFTTDIGGKMDVPTSQLILLAPSALEVVAAKILGSEMEPGVFNELNNWGPRGRFRPTLITTPYLDELSATAWYLGDFKSQFVRKHKLRMETVTMGTESERFLTARVAYQIRVAWDVEFGAVDYARVVQNVAATSAPQA